MQEYLRLCLIRHRIIIVGATGIFLTILSYVLALAVRVDFVASEIFTPHRLGVPLSILALLRYSAYVYWRLHHGFWRYASTKDLVDIGKAHLASSTLLAACVLILRLPDFPRSVIFIELAFSILLAGGLRLFVRLLRERLVLETSPSCSQNSREVVVLGAGDSGHLLIKTLFSHPRLPYRPIAVLDDAEKTRDLNVYGVLVKGPISQLGVELDANPHVTAVILAIPSLAGQRLQEVQETCAERNVALKRLQSFEDIACIDDQLPSERLSIESMLEKEVKIEHESLIHSALKGKRILITGAGGSIGSEIVRQVLQFEPSHLCLLDNSEYNLFILERELAATFVQVTRSTIIASVSDDRRLMRVFAEERPDYVFHAAAYKHVPLMEANPYEAFVNNVVGTRNVLHAAFLSGTQRFVLISSDKAVDPASIMGCSKRIAEMLVQNFFSAEPTTGSGTQTAVVRFGNVINSRGSVVPLFRQQILSGGPLTVTHPEMERYFMSIREAVRLVLTAGVLGNKGEVFVLDMGSPIRVVDVAKKMLALYGRRDIKIAFTGIRPGEKIREEISSPRETTQATSFRKVRHINFENSCYVNVKHWVNEIENRLDLLSDAEIAHLMHDFVVRASVIKAEDRGTVDTVEIQSPLLDSNRRRYAGHK